MIILDYIILAIVAFFIWQGYRSGFVGALGWLAGVFVGIWAANRYHPLVAQWLEPFIDNPFFRTIVSFVAVYVIVNIVIGLLVRFLNKIFNFIPLANFTNRVLGMVIGLIEAFIVVSLLLWVLALYPFSSGPREQVEKSAWAPYFVLGQKVVAAMLPNDFWQKTFENLKDGDIDWGQIDWNKLSPEIRERFENQNSFPRP